MNSSALYYYITQGLLIGSTGGQTVRISAVSGGGGGSTAKRSRQNWEVINNPEETKRKTLDGKRHVHGGPIPVGRYTILKPVFDAHLGNCAQLIPDMDNAMFDRDGFVIHGRGPHGSDGCIVIMNPAELESLLGALKKSNGGTLIVMPGA